MSMSSIDILPFPLFVDAEEEAGVATLGTRGALEDARREVDATGWAVEGCEKSVSAKINVD